MAKQKGSHCGWGSGTTERENMKSERKVRARPPRVGRHKYLDIYSKDNRQSFKKDSVDSLI